MSLPFTGLEAQFYDERVADWPGEIEFYQAMADEATAKGQAMLEIACGTGRVAVRLAKRGAQVTGMDLSAEMLEIARKKTRDMPNVRWVEGNMRSFDLGERYGLVIIPGHSFLFMLTPGDQVSCLNCIRRHLHPGGVLVVHLDHQDLDWLGEIGGPKKKAFEYYERTHSHPVTRNPVRLSYAWSYERATQTAIYYQHMEELGPTGEVLNRWEFEPKVMHCVFRFEMEHLLARVRYEILDLYGDFFKHSLDDKSSEMIWVARRRAKANS